MSVGSLGWYSLFVWTPLKYFEGCSYKFGKVEASRCRDNSFLCFRMWNVFHCSKLGRRSTHRDIFDPLWGFLFKQVGWVKSLVKDQTGLSDPFGCPHITTQANTVYLRTWGKNRGPGLYKMKSVFSPLRCSCFPSREQLYWIRQAQHVPGQQQTVWGRGKRRAALSLVNPLNLPQSAGQRLSELCC